MKWNKKRAKRGLFNLFFVVVIVQKNVRCLTTRSFFIQFGETNEIEKNLFEFVAFFDGTQLMGSWWEILRVFKEEFWIKFRFECSEKLKLLFSLSFNQNFDWIFGSNESRNWQTVFKSCFSLFFTKNFHLNPFKFKI